MFRGLVSTPLWARTGDFSLHSAFWAGNCCLRHPFSPVLEPRQGGDIRHAGLDCTPGHYPSVDVRLAVQAWGTPSAWRHVPRPLIPESGRWVLSPSEPCQYIPCPILPINFVCCVFIARLSIKCYFRRKLKLMLASKSACADPAVSPCAVMSLFGPIKHILYIWSFLPFSYCCKFPSRQGLSLPPSPCILFHSTLFYSVTRLLSTCVVYCRTYSIN